MVRGILLSAAILSFVGMRASHVSLADSDWGTAAVSNMARDAYELQKSGKIDAAMQAYTAAYRTARDHRQPRAAVRLLISMAACDLALLRYQEALKKFIEARKMAETCSDCASLAYTAGNLSAIYLEMHDYASASLEASRAVKLRRCMPDAGNRAQVLLQQGKLYSTNGDSARATAMFRAAIRQIPSGAADAVVATAWDRLGEELLKSGDRASAADALNRALHIRAGSNDPNLFVTQFQLAQLKFAEGDLAAARRLTEAALAKASGVRLARYHLIHLRGRVRQAQGDLSGALDDFRQALILAARWRGQILPADSFRTGADGSLQKIYDSFIEAAVTRAGITHSPTLLVEAWQAAEINRAASLREATLDDPEWRGKLPPSYWERLARFRSLEARHLTRPDPSSQAQLAQIRLELTELEVQNGLFRTSDIRFTEKNPSGISLSSLRRVLGKSRMLVTFHMGDRSSFRWDASTAGIQVTSLPSAASLNQLATDFRKAVQQDDPQRVSLGHRLYSTLFDRIATSPGQTWLLALEGNLFEIPFGALVTTVAGFPHYLIEDRPIEIIPGAWAVGPAVPPRSGSLLAIGDPIYNRADARFAAQRQASILPLSAAFSAIWNWNRETAELPRLVGSAGEIANCVRQWQGPANVLTGAAVTKNGIESALKRQPAIVHFATHFLPSRQTSPEMMIALSLQPATATREPMLELLTNSDISSQNLSASLVVLSGCSSAAGQSLPGTGLLGLTRACLAAGATNVVASRWPTPDDSGELFSSFYTYLRAKQPSSANSPAEALRRAQLDMLRSGSWRASPRYWAAYQLTGRSNSTQ